MPRPSLILLSLAAALAANPTGALARGIKTGGESAEAWAAAVVTKIAQADLKATDRDGRGGTVTVRVRIAADGALDGAAVEGGSGSAGLDERALRAVKAASPFTKPPRRIVTLEGFTEISFPLQLEPATR